MRYNDLRQVRSTVQHVWKEYVKYKRHKNVWTGSLGLNEIQIEQNGSKIQGKECAFRIALSISLLQRSSDRKGIEVFPITSAINLERTIVSIRYTSLFCQWDVTEEPLTLFTSNVADSCTVMWYWFPEGHQKIGQLERSCSYTRHERMH